MEEEESEDNDEGNQYKKGHKKSDSKKLDYE